MSEPLSELEQELQGVIESVDPVPTDVSEFARAALGWRRLDAELAELLADSALESESPALTRSTGSASRRLTFGAAELALEIELVTGGDGPRLLGQAAPPPAAATVELQDADGSVVASAETDSLGRFRLSLPAGERFRLRIVRRDPPGAPVETSWFAI